MFLWNQSTGALYLWQGVTAHDNGNSTGTFSYTQYLISPHWNRGKSLTTLEAADLNGTACRTCGPSPRMAPRART
jgi:hypothetical protein